MRFKKMLVALFACMALTAVAANSAQAAEQWNFNGVKLTGSETVSVSGGPWTLTGTTLGIVIELTATSVECGSTCTIEGEGASKGTLKFTGVEVVKPPHCTAGNPSLAVGTIGTEKLKDQVIMDPSNGAGPVFDKFAPEGTQFVEIEFHGTHCELNELVVQIDGSAGGESPNATGVEKVEQSLTFGSSQQTTSGSALTLGGGSAVLSGTAKNKLSGTKAGKAFAATEM